MRRLMTAVAMLALVAGSAHAQGNGRGGGQGGGQGGGHQSAQGGGGGGGKPDKAGRGQGGGGGGMQAVGAPREGGGSKDRGNAARGGGNGGEARGNSGQGGGNDREVARGNAGRGGGNQAVGAPREGGGSKDRGNAGRGGNDRGDLARGNGNRGGGGFDRGRGNDNDVVVGRWRDVDVVRVNDFASIRGRGLIAGCPPGLAKKNPPCVPPGQVRSAFRGYDRPDFWGLPWLGAGRYFYDDGFLVRLAPDGRIGGYIPLLGGALAIGNVWPTYYRPVAVPTYYESYYGLGPYSAYRYADNVIYRVDPETAAITSVAALLTGDDFVVGQPMPLGYDVYNVPYPYRAQYYDRPDALYRYSDGYVYQLDPETRLIAAAIELAVT